ncbi:hypothetical protein HDU93_007420 [Gonapodya sp. JEL0774]|nr:hypothetical protein HDU93_007420 [Gonapodya sp. JEL0774]
MAAVSRIRRGIFRGTDSISSARGFASGNIVNGNHDYNSFSLPPPSNFAPPQARHTFPTIDKSSTPALVIGLIASAALLAYQVHHYLTVYEPPPVFDTRKFTAFELIEKQLIAPHVYKLKFRREIPVSREADLLAEKEKSATAKTLVGGLAPTAFPSVTGSQESSRPSTPSPTHPFLQPSPRDLPPLALIHLHLREPSAQLLRFYTPLFITPTEFALVVKRYDEGGVTPWLVGRKVGAKVDMRGLFVGWEVGSQKEIGFIAAGTGITPLIQLLPHLLSTSPPTSSLYNVQPKVTLLYASRSPESILYKNELDSLAAMYPNRFRVTYTVDSTVDDAGKAQWRGLVGRVDEAMVKKAGLPPPGTGKNGVVLVCGPERMVAHLAGPRAPDDSPGPLGGVLKKMGYQQEQVVKL